VVNRMGVRLQQAQAQAGDIALLHADESEALTHPYLAHVWAEKGADLRVQAPGQAKMAKMGALDAATRGLLAHTLPTKVSAAFLGQLEMLDWRQGSEPDGERRPMVLDNGPVHTSCTNRAAFAALPWITVEWLLQYALVLNPIERIWRNRGCAIRAAVKALNQECQMPHPCGT